MTLRQPNYDRMLQLGLHGMAEAIEEQYHLPGVEALGFDDRIAMLLEREVQQRNQKATARCCGRRNCASAPKSRMSIETVLAFRALLKSDRFNRAWAMVVPKMKRSKKHWDPPKTAANDNWQILNAA